MCGKEIKTFCPRKFYCGKQIRKTGCAYKRQLLKVWEWNNKNLEKMKLWNIKAVKKYQLNKKLNSI